MVSANTKKEWNELEFLSWKEFQQMGPAIIQLEITRISKLLRQFTSEMDFYNALVKARFELNQFIAGVEKTTQAPLPNDCSDPLRRAIVAISMQEIELDEDADQTLQYVLDRLKIILIVPGYFLPVFH